MGNVEVVRALVKAGAALDQSNTNGLTPLNSAAEDGQVEAVRALVEAGADLNQQQIDGLFGTRSATRTTSTRCR